jgi:hypothetical protein
VLANIIYLIISLLYISCHVRNCSRKRQKKAPHIGHAERGSKEVEPVDEEEKSVSDSNEVETVPVPVPQAKEEKETKLSPALCSPGGRNPGSGGRDRGSTSPPIAESKTQSPHTRIPVSPSSDKAVQPLPRFSPAAASPISNVVPGSSEKPTRPVTPAVSETVSAKSTARPVKTRGAGSNSPHTRDRVAAEKESSPYEYDRVPRSPEAKKLEFESKSGEKSSSPQHKETSDYKSGGSSSKVKSSGKKPRGDGGEFASPEPGDEPPDEIVESFRSARKAIENSVDRNSESEKKKRRERSNSLNEVLLEHPDIVDPRTGEAGAGSMVPSEDVLQHHNRTNSAKELIGLSNTASPVVHGRRGGTEISPKHGTAIALADTAKALEGKMAKLKKVERRPSLNILMDSGILVIPGSGSKSDSSPHTDGKASRDRLLSEEQQFLNAMSHSTSRSRVAAAGLSSSPGAGTGASPGAVGLPPRPALSRDVSAPAFSSPRGGSPSATHIYQYIPYKILEKRVVIGLALRILAELKRRETVDEEQTGVAKQKVCVMQMQHMCNAKLDYDNIHCFILNVYFIFNVHVMFPIYYKHNLIH